MSCGGDTCSVEGSFCCTSPYNSASKTCCPQESFCCTATFGCCYGDDGDGDDYYDTPNRSQAAVLAPIIAGCSCAGLVLVTLLFLFIRYSYCKIDDNIYNTENIPSSASPSQHQRHVAKAPPGAVVMISMAGVSKEPEFTPPPPPGLTPTLTSEQQVKFEQFQQQQYQQFLQQQQQSSSVSPMHYTAAAQPVLTTAVVLPSRAVVLGTEQQDEKAEERLQPEKKQLANSDADQNPVVASAPLAPFGQTDEARTDTSSAPPAVPPPELSASKQSQLDAFRAHLAAQRDSF